MICFSLIGCLNVGKLLIVNVLLGEDWVIVFDVVGIIWDVIDIKFIDQDGDWFVMVDMVGICKKGKVYENIECYSVMCVFKVIDNSDVVFFVINGEEGICEQDKWVVGYVYEVGKGIIIVVNKWDLVKKDNYIM